MTNNNVNVTGGKAGHWTHGNEYDKLKDKKVLDGLKSPSKEDSATYTVFNTKQDTKSPHLALRTKPTSGKKATTVVKMKDGTKVIRLKKKKGSWLYVEVKGTDKKGWCNAFWLKSSAADGFSVKPTHEIYNTSKDKKAPYLALRTYPTAGKGSATAPASTIAQMPDGTQIYKFTDPGSKKGKWVKIQILNSKKSEIIGLAGWAHSKFMKKSKTKGAIASADIYKVIVTHGHDVEGKVSKEHIIEAKPLIRELALNIILLNNGMTKDQIGENPLDIKKQILDSVKTTDLYDVPTGENTGGTQVKYLVLYKNGKKEQDLIKKAIAHKPDKTEYEKKKYTIDEHLKDLARLKLILSAVTTKIKQHEQEEGRYIYNFDVINHNIGKYPQEIEERSKSFQKYINEGIQKFDSENITHKGKYIPWGAPQAPAPPGNGKKTQIEYSWTIPENEKPIIAISNIHYEKEKNIIKDVSDGATHEVFNTKGAKDGEYLALRNKPSGATGKDGKKKGVKTLVQMVDGTRVKQATTKKGKGIKGGKKKKWFKLTIVDPRHKDKGTSGWAHSKWLKKPDSKSVTFWAPWKENDIVAGAAIKQNYDPYFINIVYHIKEIVEDYSASSMNKEKAVTFVEQYFVKPPLQQQTIPREAKRVFNEGKIKYKNQRNIQEETLNDRIKRDIHETVKFKYQNTSDQVFLSMIKDIGSMKTVEDIYEKVLYAIPVSELIKTVAECLMKGLSLPDLKAAICDNILKDIDEEILNKVLAHLGTSQSGVAAVIKGKMEKAMTENAPSSEALGEGPGANVYNEAMGDLIASSVDSVSEKDALCIAILAIAPVALLSALGLADPDLERGLILNPAKHFLQSIQDRVNQYSITGLTQGWTDLIIQLIDDLIEEFIVNAIQKLLKEIAILCEGSAKADMAGMPGIEGATLPPAFLNPTMPFVPFDLTDHLRATGNDDVYDDLVDTFDVSADLIKSFLDDLTNLLTVSEICTLLDEDASDINKTYIAGKIWSALIEEGEYAILGSKLGGIPGLIQFFYVLGMKVDQQYCVDKIDALRRTKKVLSDLCGPASNGALIEDLKNKVTQDVIDDLLNQEKDIAKDTLDTLLNLADPSRITKQVPPLFCGPDAENSTKEPLFDSHQHDSAKFLTEKFLKQIISGITKQFEQDLTFYKSIFLTPKLDMIGITNEVPNVTASVFGLTDKVDTSSLQVPTDKDALNKLLDNYQYIAKKVHKLLSESQDGINVSAHTDDDFLSIYASPDISDEVAASEENRLSLNMNYGDVPQSAQGAAEVDPGTSTIIVGGLEQQSNTNLSPYKDLVGIINSFTSNAYDTTIKKQVVEGLEFYAYLLKTVIVEHAEHITQLDLFKKKNFDKLELKKVESDDPCAGSLLFPDNILQKVDEHTQALECKKEFSDIPAAYEVAQINLYVDILHRLVLIEQMLKSVFVFVAYDIYSLLPENNYDNSFYYKYISSQVKNRLNSFSSFQSINFNINEVIEKYSTQVYAAMEDLEIKSDISQDTQIIQDTKKWLLNEAFADVRNTFTERLSKPKLIGTEFEGTLEEEFVDVQAGSTPPAKQVLQNIISPVQKDPPIIEKIDYKNRKFFVAKGTYSDDPKLQNGGFFLERGFEFVPKYGPSANINSGGGAWQLSVNGWLGTSASTILKHIDDLYTSILNPDEPFVLGAGDYTFFAKLFNFFTPNMETEAGLFGDFDYYSQTSKLSIALSAEAEEENFILDGYFDFIGKMSLDEYFKKYYLLSNHQNLEEYTINAAIQGMLNGDQSQAEYAKMIYNTHILPLFQNNEIFTRYTDYYSLNLLLVVPEDANSILRKKYNSILESASQFDNLISDGQIEESFYDALSDKKYFIQETGGKLYFKLPLIVRYPFEEENPNYSDLQKMNEFKNHLGTALAPNAELLSQLAEDPLFVYFTNIINYKDLLSYIALIVTESLEQEYSDLKTLFDRTIIAVLNALGAALSGANRQMDPEFYQDSNFNAGATAPGVEWVGVMFKALIKSLATMVDPTWQTDWFMPGPFTPFGVTAKLLEGLDEDEEDEEGEGEAETTECFDSVDDSGEPSPGDGVQDPDE